MIAVAALILLLHATALPAQVGDDWLGPELFEEHGVIKLIIDPVDGTIVAANRAFPFRLIRIRYEASRQPESHGTRVVVRFPVDFTGTVRYMP